MIETDYEIDITNGVIEQFTAITGREIDFSDSKRFMIYFPLLVEPTNDTPIIVINNEFFELYNLKYTDELNDQLVDFLSDNCPRFEGFICSFL